MKVLLSLILLCSIVSAEEKSFEKDLTITDSTLTFSQENNYRTVSIIGHIKNEANNNYSDFVFEATFFNQQNQLIDTITDRLYDNVVLANDSATFRLRRNADKQQDQYVSHKIRLLSATAEKPCCSKKKTYTVKQFLSDWGGPLMITLWVGLMVYSSIKYQKAQEKSEQKVLTSINEQTKILSEIAENIKHTKD